MDLSEMVHFRDTVFPVSRRPARRDSADWAYPDDRSSYTEYYDTSPALLHVRRERATSNGLLAACRQSSGPPSRSSHLASYLASKETHHPSSVSVTSSKPSVKNGRLPVKSLRRVVSALRTGRLILSQRLPPASYVWTQSLLLRLTGSPVGVLHQCHSPSASTFSQTHSWGARHP